MTALPRLEGTSRLGFGTYRVSAGVRAHEEALRHALARGCSLVDTASTYGGGRSEELVGRVIRELEPAARPYVVTKAGYSDAGYSIRPDFLRSRLALSRERLGLQRVDAFLLHNPEHWFEGRTADETDEFYAVVETAFAFLEEEVEGGRIGCYGVSSNSLPRCEDPTSPRPARLVEAAERASAAHNFRILQFPLNLIERDAALPCRGRESLIEAGHGFGLRLIGQRPLNALAPGGAVRLATYPPGPSRTDDGGTQADVEDALALLTERAAATQPPDHEELPIVAYLRREWRELPSVDATDAIFARFVDPLVEMLYGGVVPPAHRDILARFYTACAARARQNMSRTASDYRSKLTEAGLLTPGDPRSLAVLACEYALACGLDNVLVGMRRVEYVDELSPLLADSVQGR